MTHSINNNSNEKPWTPWQPMKIPCMKNDENHEKQIPKKLEEFAEPCCSVSCCSKSLLTPSQDPFCGSHWTCPFASVNLRMGSSKPSRLPRIRNKKIDRISSLLPNTGFHWGFWSGTWTCISEQPSCRGNSNCFCAPCYSKVLLYCFSAVGEN